MTERLCVDCLHFWTGPFGGMAECLKYSAHKATLDAKSAREKDTACGPSGKGFELSLKARAYQRTQSDAPARQKEGRQQ